MNLFVTIRHFCATRYPTGGVRCCGQTPTRTGQLDKLERRNDQTDSRPRASFPTSRGPTVATNIHRRLPNSSEEAWRRLDSPPGRARRERGRRSRNEGHESRHGVGRQHGESARGLPVSAPRVVDGMVHHPQAVRQRRVASVAVTPSSRASARPHARHPPRTPPGSRRSPRAAATAPSGAATPGNGDDSRTSLRCRSPWLAGLPRRYSSCGMKILGLPQSPAVEQASAPPWTTQETSAP